METFGFRLIESADLPRRDKLDKAVDYDEAVREAALENGAMWEDFRIRDSELRAHLRNLGTLAGLGAKLLELVRNTPPPSAAKPIEGFSYIDLKEVEPILQPLSNITPATLEAIESDDDLAAVYHLLVGVLEEARKRELHIAVVEL
jgi:hypothetical protein